jgi:hypothetical protein
MRIAGWLTKRQVAGCLVIFLAAPFAKAAAQPGQDSVSARPEQGAVSSKGQETGSNSGSGNPNAVPTQSETALPDAPEVAQSQSGNGQSGSSQPGQERPQNDAAQPVGTAAAPYEMTTGVAASKPAGAVIAPAKQHRVRAILISVGVIVGACVALGTVAGLSHTSPSQPK